MLGNEVFSASITLSCCINGSGLHIQSSSIDRSVVTKLVQCHYETSDLASRWDAVLNHRKKSKQNFLQKKFYTLNEIFLRFISKFFIQKSNSCAEFIVLVHFKQLNLKLISLIKICPPVHCEIRSNFHLQINFLMSRIKRCSKLLRCKTLGLPCRSCYQRT